MDRQRWRRKVAIRVLVVLRVERGEGRDRGPDAEEEDGEIDPNLTDPSLLSSYIRTQACRMTYIIQSLIKELIHKRTDIQEESSTNIICLIVIKYQR